MQKKKEKRALILEAAAAEFRNRRFDEVTLDGIAVRAGVGKGTLYLYFTNKEDLFLQMALDGVEEMTVRTRQITEMDGAFRDRFFMFGREAGVFMQSRSVMFRLMDQTFSSEIHNEFFRRHKKLIQAVRALLQAGRDEGVLRDDFTVADLHCLLIGPLLFRVRLNENNRDTIAVNSLLDLFWDAAARGAS